VALAVAVEWIDLHQRGVGLQVALVELLENVLGLGCRALGHVDALADLCGLFVGEALERVHEHLADLLRVAVGDFLDVHAPFTGRDEGDLLRGAVGDHGHVIFLADVRAFFDVQAPHLLALGPGLVGLELHAQDLAGQVLHVVYRAGQLDATALAPPSGVDLGLDHAHRRAQFLSRFNRLLDGEGGVSARHGHAELAQDFLALVLVNLHGCLPVYIVFTRTPNRMGGAKRFALCVRNLALT